MRRLVLTIVLLMVGVGQAMAAPSAMCRHADAAAHQVALLGADGDIAADAQHEEIAAAVKKLGTVSDVLLAGMTLAVLPSAAPAMTATPEAPMWFARAIPLLGDMAAAPLLRPPLG
jgi:hypothetical protein